MKIGLWILPMYLANVCSQLRWTIVLFMYTGGHGVMSLSRAKWISFRGSHWAQGMVHLSVVTLISSNGQEHIPHHCISLHYRESSNICIMCKHIFCVTFEPWCNSCGLFLIDRNRKWTPTSTSRSCQVMWSHVYKGLQAVSSSRQESEELWHSPRSSAPPCPDSAVCTVHSSGLLAH
jgi:hypothetical protein